MSIVTKDIQWARQQICGGEKIATTEKNQAHRRHRRNQKYLLAEIARGSVDADEDDVDFNTKPCTGWDIW